MSAGNFHGIVNGNGSIVRNGPPARESVPVRQRNSRRPAPGKPLEVAAKPGPEPAGYVKTESQAQDSPMWPIHPVMWLQPELRFAVPAASGLNIERKHTVPAPHFLPTAMTPVSHPASLQKAVHPVLPRVSPQFPASGLTPLGWDPRVAAYGTGREDRE
jgi:hypothetical protein